MRNHLRPARLIFGLFVLCITAWIGVASAGQWYRLLAPTVTLRTLASNPDYYDGKTVRVKAPAYGFENWILLSDVSCDSPDAKAGVTFAPSFTADGEVREFLDEFTGKRSIYSLRRADVTVTGRFNAWASTGCITPGFEIVATDIEVNSPIVYEAVVPEQNEFADSVISR
jgi:hypothetical protein